MLHVKFFASVRERLGVGEMDWDFPSDGCTVGDLLQQLEAHFGQDLAGGHLLAARNHVHVPFSEPLRDGDEVAFFPPVTGG
ncbi:MAG: MoaD/ThiS family protein [Acidithiobacillus sp.]|nr:MoaD/ThiS family protein [Acidithiobacillus sp.]